MNDLVLQLPKTILIRLFNRLCQELIKISNTKIQRNDRAEF